MKRDMPISGLIRFEKTLLNQLFAYTEHARCCWSYGLFAMKWNMKRSCMREYLLTTNERFINPDFRRAYDWMISELARRVTSPPEVGCYPLWAWWRWWGARRPRPDLRFHHIPQGTRGVRIHFEIDSSQVLLSDYMGWHSVRIIFRTIGKANVWPDETIEGTLLASWRFIYDSCHSNSRIGADVPALRICQAGNNANRRLSVLL